MPSLSEDARIAGLSTVWAEARFNFAFFPENRAVNLYAQTDWDAVGIQPDIKVPAAAALQVALRQAQSLLRTK
jgi:hypothetical protein